jgi:hypothetical protein
MLGLSATLARLIESETQIMAHNAIDTSLVFPSKNSFIKAVCQLEAEPASPSFGQEHLG